MNTLLKTVSSKGVEEEYFLGREQAEQRSAERILKVIKTTCINTVGHIITEYI